MIAVIRGSVFVVMGISGTAVTAAAQSNLTAAATSPTRVVLSWTGAPGANGYWILRGAGSATLAKINSAKVSGTSYTDLTAPAGTALKYRIRATYPNNPNTQSNRVIVTTPAAPGGAASAAPPPPATVSAEPVSPIAHRPGPPTTEGAPVRLAEAAPVATSPRLVPPGAPSGPAPQNLRIESWGPLTHRLSWDRIWNATYTVAFRTTSEGPFHPLHDGRIYDSLFDHLAFVNSGAQYRVTAFHDQREGITDFVYASPPAPQVPTGFTASQAASDRVVLRWHPVPFAKQYRVFGAGQPHDGSVVHDTVKVVPGLPYGTHSWQVTADYGGVYATAGLPAVSVTLATNVVAAGTTHGPKRLSVRTFGGGEVQDWSWPPVPVASNYKLLRTIAPDSPTCLIPALALTCGVFAEVEHLYYRTDKLSARDRTATIGETYLYKVLAYVGLVPIGESPVLRIKIEPRPPGVTNLTATWSKRGGGWVIGLRWLPAPGASHYNIWRAVNGGPMEPVRESGHGTYVLKLGGNAYRYDDTSVGTGPSYQYRVTTYLPSGDIAQDAYVTVRIGS